MFIPPSWAGRHQTKQKSEEVSLASDYFNRQHSAGKSSPSISFTGFSASAWDLLLSAVENKMNKHFACSFTCLIPKQVKPLPCSDVDILVFNLVAFPQISQNPDFNDISERIGISKCAC